MTHVLFVDDEPSVLNAYGRALSHRSSWRISTATSGEEALARLSAESADVVVSDLRMPRMSGEELLTAVRHRHPRALRIALSGAPEREASVRATRVAHEFVTKRCTSGGLRFALERSARTWALLRDEELQRLVDGPEGVPATPNADRHLGALLDSAVATPRDTAELLARDPLLCEHLLNVIRSSLFLDAAAAGDIRAAAARVEPSTLRDLALSAGAFAESVGIRVGLDVDELHRTALRRATIASMVATTEQVRGRAVAAAMLCDVGKLVLARRGEPTFREALDAQRTSGRPLHEIEARLGRFTHAEVGAYLLAAWGLPLDIVEAVASHHRPESLDEPQNLDAVTAVCVAQALLEGVERPPEWLRVPSVLQRWTDLRIAAWTVRGSRVG